MKSASYSVTVHFKVGAWSMISTKHFGSDGHAAQRAYDMLRPIFQSSALYDVRLRKGSIALLSMRHALEAAQATSAHACRAYAD